MKKLQLVLLFGVLLFSCQSFSQKSNTESILGCWKFKKIEFFEESEFNYQSNIEAKNTVVCFDENGTFTNKKIMNFISKMIVHKCIYSSHLTTE
ncbi:MAG: hypothetical protein MUF43_10880 [Flavobacterium sp.]|nr:hypothetical protein [Flavobacterium sp.]